MDTPKPTLQSLIEETGYTQPALAEELGVSSTTVFRWYKGSGIRPPSKRKLLAFAKRKGILERMRQVLMFH
jgi:transcriptional regulator with XRE-family HTH domain